MKRILLYFAAAAVAAVMFAACSPSEKEFNKEFLYSNGGKWVCNSYPISGTTHTVYDVYYSNGTGKSWDIDDGLTEADAQAFEWTLSGETLSQNPCMESSSACWPYDYAVSELTETRMVYTRAGHTYTWTKVN